MIRLQWAHLTRAQLKSCWRLYCMWLSVTLLSEKASENKKKKKKNIELQAENHGLKILKRKMLYFYGV